MPTDQTFDISSDSSPFRLKNHTYYLNGFKIVCNVSQNIHCFDVYHEGFPIGSIDVKMAQFYQNSILEAHKQNKIIAVNIDVKSHKEPERIKSTIMMGGNTTKSIGSVWFCNKNGGTLFEPLNIEIDLKELPHLCVERKVLFEKTIKSKLKINLGEYVFSTDVWGGLENFYVQAVHRMERAEHFQPVVIDYFPKLEA